MSSHHKVVIIGAGVSGLVTLKTLRQLGIDCVVFEANSYHGGLWHYNQHTYGVMDFTYINVSRYNYAFSDYPFPDNGTEFAHHTQISDYIDSYVDHFNLSDHIQYKTRVTQASKSAGVKEHFKHNWTVKCETESEEFLVTCEYLVIATGHHAKPKIPSFPGEDKFTGEIIHSVKYKDVSLSGYEGKNVVLIGIGNSSVDIADNLVSKGRCPKVHISTRTGAWVFPNYFFGSPSDVIFNRAQMLAPPNVANLMMKGLIMLFTGHPTRWGLNPKYDPIQTHPTVSPTLIHHIQRGWVQISPDIQEIGADYVQFEDGSRAENVEVIIKCTGYTIDLPYLDVDVRELILNEETNELKMFHTVLSPEIGPTLALVGYVQQLGGLISISEIQAQWLGMIITGQCSLPSVSEMKERIAQDKMIQLFYKKSTRHTIQRAVTPYCDEISEYFGGKPRLKDNLSIAHRLLFGSGGAAQWTLQGPYYNPKAADIVRKVPIPVFNVISPFVAPSLALFLLYVLYLMLSLILF